MTYEEFIEKYGEIEVRFRSYYKYAFTFTSEDGSINVGFGGSADDIYREQVTTEPVKIKDGGWSWAKIGEDFHNFGGW